MRGFVATVESHLDTTTSNILKRKAFVERSRELFALGEV